MATPPTNAIPNVSPAEMQILVSRAGLVLNPGQLADLVMVWRQVAGLIAAIPSNRPLADDMAVTFRLPPPASTTVGRPDMATGDTPRADTPRRPVAKPSPAATRDRMKAAATPVRTLSAKSGAKSGTKTEAKSRAKPAPGTQTAAKPKSPAKPKAAARRTRPSAARR